MFILAILAIIAFLLIGFVVLFASLGGAVFVIIFGDVIIAVALIALLIRFIVKRRKKKD